jgi:hypothetical protein
MSTSSTKSTNKAEGSGTKRAEGIDDMLQRLGIEDDEIDDLVFEEEEEVPKEGLKWFALARVHTENYFSPQTFEQHMKVAWSPAQEVKIKPLEQNLFTIQCHCLGDWLKVEKGGPWLFRQNAVIIEKYDGLAAPESIDLNFVAVWMQIHKLPPGYRNKTLITNLTEKKVGSVIEVETDIEGVNNFVRVRVKLDVRKPLARFVTIVRAGKREFYAIKFEKMPKFCGACGFFGHNYLECGSGEHDESKLKWGDWLKADWETWHGRNFGGTRGGGRGRGSAGEGRGRDPMGRGTEPPGRGRGTNVSWRYNALPYVDGTATLDDELADAGTSPVKKSDVDMDDREPVDKAAKRRLDLVTDNPEDEERELSKNSDDGALPMITNGSIGEAPVNEDASGRTKRSKKAGADSPSLGSAGSFEGSVRSQ